MLSRSWIPGWVYVCMCVYSVNVDMVCKAKNGLPWFEFDE